MLVATIFYTLLFGISRLMLIDDNNFGVLVCLFFSSPSSSHHLSDFCKPIIISCTSQRPIEVH